jgi:hypothetical protein
MWTVVDALVARAILHALAENWPERVDLGNIEIEDRPPHGLVVTVSTSTPGLLLGPRGRSAGAIRDHVRAAVPDKTVQFRVHEVVVPAAREPGCETPSGREGERDGTDRDRLTDRVRRVLVLAQEEARLLNHGFVGTEHILLGLIHEGEGVAARALESLGITLEAARAQVEAQIGRTRGPPRKSPPFTPRAKKVLELSLREALQLGHSFVGTEHLLLGLVREGEGVGAQVLTSMGVPPVHVRQRVIALMSGGRPKDS